MIGLTSLEVYLSAFIVPEENSTSIDCLARIAGEILYERISNELEKELRFSDITHNDLQDKITEPIKIGQYGRKVPKKKFDDAYGNLQACSINSIFQEFKSYLGTEVGLVEGDIGLV